MSSETFAVVGAGPGVGLSVARKFAKEGFNVALLARRADALAEYVKDFEGNGLSAKAFVADASNPESLSKALADVSASLGTVTALIYNAAALRSSLPAAETAEQLVQDFKVNVVGALTAVQEVIPAMKEAGSGTIIFTGGGLSLNPFAQYASLAIGKAGLRSLAFSLAQELGPAGIHVATVTICGIVKPGGRYDPDKIADRYWDLHAQPKEQWETEFIYK